MLKYCVILIHLPPQTKPHLIHFIIKVTTFDAWIKQFSSAQCLLKLALVQNVQAPRPICLDLTYLKIYMKNIEMQIVGFFPEDVWLILLS